MTDIKSLDLPIGWAEANRPDTAAGWIAKFSGWVVTVFALLLGAPFWFDTLSKLARLRNTGKPEGTAKGDTGKSRSSLGHPPHSLSSGRGCSLQRIPRAMLVHSFGEEDVGFEDFAAFAHILGTAAELNANLGERAGVDLYLG